MKTQVVDLEALVCGGGSSDRRITCETLVPDQDHDDEDDAAPPPPPSQPQQPHHLDYAPDSFWVSRDAEFDWFDRNAFFERKGSTKGADFANSSAHSSQRFSMNLKKSKAAASIIGLPKSQKSYTADAKTRRNHHHPNNNRFFLGRREGSGKTTTLLNEPSSPKVSCIGRVRSKSDRNRRLKNRKTSSVPGSESVKAEGSKRKKKQKNRGKQSRSDDQAEVKTESRTRKGKGLWKNLRALFRSHRKKDLDKLDKTSAYGEGKSVTRNGLKQEPVAVRGGVTMVVPSLGGMTRFVSGRRSDSWVGDADWQHERAATSGPLDKEPVWKRRDVDPPPNVRCSRDWEAEGPASV